MSDGVRFTEVLDRAPWSPRYGAVAAVFHDQLWMMAGCERVDGARRNDVWATSDGHNWRLVQPSAPWSPRWVPALFALNDRLWLIGGLDAVNPIHNLNDIWCSEDGSTWTKVLDQAPWVERHVFATAIHRGRMHIIAGATTGSLYHNDVQVSADGIRWQTIEPSGPWFSKRKNHAAASFRGKLWVAGGSMIDRANVDQGGSRYLNDVWCSGDGSNWQQVLSEAPWSPRTFHDLLVLHDRMWLISGNFGRTNYGSDIWSTADGENWSRQTQAIPWPLRHGAATVVFRDRIWMMGGTSASYGESSRNDVWNVDHGPSKGSGSL